MYSEKELSLAERYINGECNDIQYNYIVSTEGMDRNRLDELIKEMSYHSPLLVSAKILLLFIVFNFFFCLLYSVVSYILV